MGVISCPVNDLLYEPSPRPLGTPLPCLGEGTGARAGYRKRLCGHDIRLEMEADNFNEADFKHQTWKVHLVGNLTLNHLKVRCIADIDIETLEGKGHLEPIEE